MFQAHIQHLGHHLENEKQKPARRKQHKEGKGIGKYLYKGLASVMYKPKGWKGEQINVPYPDEMPPKTIIIQMVNAAYEPAAKAATTIAGWELIKSTDTLKFYKKGDEIIVAIRGTADGSDISADAQLAIRGVRPTVRFQKDVKTMNEVKAEYPDATYYGCGHSLGGAILDAFIKSGDIVKGVSYNPAVEKSELDSTKNYRIYMENDPLFNTMGQYSRLGEVRKQPPVSFISDGIAAAQSLKSHLLSNFVGGRRPVIEGGEGTFDILKDINPIKIASFIAPHLEGDQSVTGTEYAVEKRKQQAKKDAEAQLQQQLKNADIAKKAQEMTDKSFGDFSQNFEKRFRGTVPSMLKKMYISRTDAKNAKALSGGDFTGVMRGLIGLPPNHQEQLKQLRNADLTEGYVPQVNQSVSNRNMNDLLKRGRGIRGGLREGREGRNRTQSEAEEDALVAREERFEELRRKQLNLPRAEEFSRQRDRDAWDVRNALLNVGDTEYERERKREKEYEEQLAFDLENQRKEEAEIKRLKKLLNRPAPKMPTEADERRQAQIRARLEAFLINNPDEDDDVRYRMINHPDINGFM